MLKLELVPKNREKYVRLLDFLRKVMKVCDELKIKPILDGSLAVLAYTRNQSIEVNDIDFSHTEVDFPKLKETLLAKGINTEIQPWHVLQVRQDDLKIEFGDIDYWFNDIADLIRKPNKIQIEELQLNIVSLEALIAMYEVGAESTKDNPDKKDKHQEILKKIELLKK